MAEFRRGLSDEFIAALRRLSTTGGWWRDVLSDPSLIIAVRDEALNVYWHGQSIFKVTFRGWDIGATTHPKYLLDPDLSKQVMFDGGQFDLVPDAVIHTYEPGKTLAKLKRAAGLFAGDERRGVHDICIANDSVVDVEITMAAGELPDVGSLPRADIAAFEDGDQGMILVLWEAKTFYNAELRLTGAKNVIDQIRKYKRIVAARRASIIKSYSRVARNLVDIAAMSAGHRKVAASIHKVATGTRLLIREPPDVGLLVFGFDAAQRDRVWKPLQGKFAKALGPTRVKARGSPRGFKI